jgi:hypothetical protein
MTREQHVRLVESFLERMWNTPDPAAPAELLTDPFLNLGRSRRPADMARIVDLWRAGFPDLHVAVDDVLVEDDRVAARLTLRGTHIGDFSHPTIGTIAATGRAVTVTQSHTFRIAGNRISEHDAVRDDLDLLRQLGALPTTTGPRRSTPSPPPATWYWCGSPPAEPTSARRFPSSPAAHRPAELSTPSPCTSSACGAGTSPNTGPSVTTSASYAGSTPQTRTSPTGSDRS